jgi:hypothetical protein
MSMHVKNSAGATMMRNIILCFMFPSSINAYAGHSKLDQPDILVAVGSLPRLSFLPKQIMMVNSPDMHGTD